MRALVESWCAATTGPRRIERLPAVEPVPAGRAWFAGVGLDVRLAFRLLRQQPGFALVSILMIALAIAGATSLFSVVNSVLLNPLPHVKTEGLVRVFETESKLVENRPAISNVTYYAWTDKPQTIDGIGTWNESTLPFEGASGLELVHAAGITASLFPLIGIQPVLGAFFTEADETSGDAVILSHGFWQERFGAAPDALGKRITVGGKPRTIVGVMPLGFAFPDREARFWVPQRPPQIIKRETKNSIAISFSNHNGLARLKPGVTPEQAAAEAAARIKGSMQSRPQMMNDMFGPDGAPKIILTPMIDWMIKDVKPALWILSAAVILLFAAAIGNVANMQLARAATRQREVAIRSAIGAGGGRLIRQLLVETSVLAAAGGAIGLAITFAVLRVLPAQMPEDLPYLQGITIDGRVLLVAAGLTMAVSLVIGLMPARMSRHLNLTSALAEDGAAPVGHSMRSPIARTRALIITGQVAIAALLLVGAGLLSQTLLGLVNIDRGYQPANLLSARLTHVLRGQPAGVRPIFFKEVLERLTTTPGVTHAALSTGLPLTPTERDAHGRVEVNPPREIEGELHAVTTDYIAAMGMRLVRGRAFTSSDVPSSELVVLVNETFAKRYLPSEPLSAIVSLELDEKRGCAPTKAIKSACTNPWRVIGIVADVRHSGTDASVEPAVYAPRSQFMSAMPGMQYVTVRTTGDPAALAATLRDNVRTASPNSILDQVMTMETRLMRSLARPRLYAVLVAGFAIFAVLIALIGLFGGLSYTVMLRTREIGVRTALGAMPRHIVGMVLKQGTVMTLCGLAIGLGAAAATVRYLATFLFGIEPLDVATFAAVAAGLMACATVASAVPARRAAKINAIEALRH